MINDESLEEMVNRRNKRLLSFFTKCGFSVRLVGDSQKPNVVLNESVILSCYVKNFDLYFTKEPFSDQIVSTFKLKNEIESSKLEIQEAIELCVHRPVYKIALTNTTLYLVGFNYLSSEDATGRYPVFAKFKPKVYFDKEYAEKLFESLKSDGYSLQLV